MDIRCSAEPCPIILNATCVFYAGENLVYTGIVTNDNLQTALQKIDAKFHDAGLGYIFNNGIIQYTPGDYVQLGGKLVKPTTLDNNTHPFIVTESIESAQFITTGGTVSQFVKGNGTLDSTSYQPTGNYITALTGDGTATGPGSVVFTLSDTGVTANTYGSGSVVPIITVDSKGRITNVTNSNIYYPPQYIALIGDINGAGYTGNNILTTLANINPNVFGSNTPLKFAVNNKGLITSAALLTNFDLDGIYGYTPVPNTRTITINGITQSLINDRSWTITSSGVNWGDIIGDITNQTDLINYLSTNYYPVTNPDGYISDAPVDGVIYGRQNSDWVGVTVGTGTVASVAAGTGMNFTTITSTGNVDIDTTKVPYYATPPSNGLLKYTSGVWGIDTSTYLTSIPIATSSILGGVKIGSGVSVALDGTISVSTNYQAPLSGTGVVKSTAGTISYISGTSSQFIKGDGSLDSNTYLTSISVGLSMPSAFTVTNSPVTSIGTLTVTGAGTTAQYVRGDGSLATYNPGSGSGGASQVFYFNGSVASGVTGYKQMSTIANTGASFDFTISSNGYIASFLTDVTSPNQLNIPAGNWNFEIYFNSSSAGGSPSFYVELYKYNGSFTLISSSSANPEYITNGTAVDLYTTALTVPATTLLTTDRLAIRVYVVPSGRTITMHTQDSNLSEVITTFSTGITALNGLTDQVQNFATPGTTGTSPNWSSVSPNHTLNIPLASTASVTAGLISKTDYDTFNGKQASSTNLTSLSGLTYASTSFVKMTAAGTFTLDTNTYLTGLTIGSTAISSGTTTRILYNNAGVLGEYTLTGTGTTAVMSTAPTFTTNITTPIVIGGTGTTSPLTIQPTNGVGVSGSDIRFRTGNNGATKAMTIKHDGILVTGIITANTTDGYQDAIRLSPTTNIELYPSSSYRGSITSTYFNYTAKTYLGANSSPAAVLHLTAGLATASSAPLKFTLPGAILSTPEAGVVETSAERLFFTPTSLGRQQLPGVLFTQTADKTVGNTITEISIIGTGVSSLLTTNTLPANFFIAGKTIRIIMRGYYSTVAVTGDVITVKIKYGSTVLATKATTALVTGGSNLAWDLDVDVTCRTSGASGTVQVGGKLFYQIAGAAAIMDEINNGRTTTTLDTTVAGLLDVTIAHSAANASNTITSLNCSIEVLN